MDTEQHDSTENEKRHAESRCGYGSRTLFEDTSPDRIEREIDICEGMLSYSASHNQPQQEADAEAFESKVEEFREGLVCVQKHFGLLDVTLLIHSS